jgi:hypothetical protein
MQTELLVETHDGRQGQIATPLLQASAYKPVLVQFPEGDRKPYYLRELKIADSDPQRRPA